MKRFSFSKLMLVLGLLFIYLPMLILVIYSFNASKLVTVWGGWSIKWYVGLLDNTQLMGSVMRSLEIACYTAVAAVAPAAEGVAAGAVGAAAMTGLLALGVAPMEYLFNWRIAMARSLLRRKAGSVAEASRKLYIARTKSTVMVAYRPQFFNVKSQSSFDI